MRIVTSLVGRLAPLAMIGRFGIVGLAATFLHVAVFSACIEFLGWDALVANTLAFVIAFALSFWGHFGWTFAGLATAQRRGVASALPRFLAVSLFGFALNSAAVWVIVQLLGWPYPIAAGFMIFVTPVAIFLASRFWAFGGGRSAETN